MNCPKSDEEPIFFIPLYRKSFPNKQSDADHGNQDGCQLITPKRGNSSNSLDFKGVYSLYRFTKNLIHNETFSIVICFGQE